MKAIRQVNQLNKLFVLPLINKTWSHRADGVWSLWTPKLSHQSPPT